MNSDEQGREEAVRQPGGCRGAQGSWFGHDLLQLNITEREEAIQCWQS